MLRTISYAALRGAATATGSSTATWIIWWLTHR